MPGQQKGLRLLQLHLDKRLRACLKPHRAIRPDKFLKGKGKEGRGKAGRRKKNKGDKFFLFHNESKTIPRAPE